MVSKKKGKKNHFLIGKDRHVIGEKGCYFLIGNEAEIWPIEKDRKCPVGPCEAWYVHI